MPDHYGKKRAKKAYKANVRTLKRLDKSMLSVHKARGFAGFGHDVKKVDKGVKNVERQVRKIGSMGSSADKVSFGEYGKSRFDRNIKEHHAKQGKRNRAIVTGLKAVGRVAKMGLKTAGPIGVIMSLFDAKPAGLGSDKPSRRKKKK